MCTLVILSRPENDWPLIVAANRDEMRDRPWLKPERHWPDRPDVIAGLDELAGGTWLGMNDFGLIAAVLNRTGTLGPDPDLRSRGELPLEALDHAEAEMAADALANLEPRSYKPFNLFVGDVVSSYCISSDGRNIEVQHIPDGLSMLTDKNLNDPESKRLARYRPLFRDATPPEPEQEDWSAWMKLLSERMTPDTSSPGEAMNIELLLEAKNEVFGTVSSSLIGLPAVHLDNAKPKWLFAAAPPDTVPYEPVI